MICLHTHEHTSITRILAQAKFLKGRAAADLLLYSRWEASSAKRAFEQWPSLPGSESSNWACQKAEQFIRRTCPFGAMYGQQKKVTCYEEKYQDQCWDSQQRLYLARCDDPAIIPYHGSGVTLYCTMNLSLPSLQRSWLALPPRRDRK